MSKKLQEKQRKRLAEQMRRDQQRKAARRSNMITIGIAVVIIAAVTVFIFNERATETQAVAAPEGVPASEAGCDPVEEHEEQGNEHVAPGSDVQYETSPPTSGDHWEQPNETGFFPSEVPEEGLVHNLEHGQIVFWYSPDAPDDVISDIEQAVEQEEFSTVGVPYANLNTDKNFVMAAWGVTQACDQVSQTVVDEFRSAYQGTRGPEPLTPRFEG